MDEIIPPEIAAALEAEGVDLRNPDILQTLSVSLQYFRGPLPPPHWLREYQAIDPELPKKIVQWTEIQAGHRRGLEVQRASRAERRLDRGQIIAGVVAIGGLVISAVAGVLGATAVAIFIAILAIGGPTAAIAMTRYWPTRTPPTT